MKARITSLHGHATIFIVLVCCALVGIDGVHLWSTRLAAIRHSQTQTENLARAVAQHAQDTLQTADVILAGLVNQLEDKSFDQQDVDRLHHLLQSRFAHAAMINNLFIYDAAGQWVTNSLSEAPPQYSAANNDYFQFHQIHTDTGPHLGEPVTDKNSGHWVLPVTRRYNHPNGSFAGVVLAAIDLQYFLDFYKTFDIGDQGAIGLFSTSQNRFSNIVRRPFDETQIGLVIPRLTKPPMLADMPRLGNVTIKSSFDGIERFGSYDSLDQFPARVFVSLSKEEVLAEWRAAVWQHALSMSLLISCIMFAGRRLQRQVRRREHAEQKLRRSEALFSGVFDQSPDCIFVVSRDSDGTLRNETYNATAEKLLGSPRQVMSGKLLSELMPDAHFQEQKAAYDTVIATNKPLHLDSVLNHIDNEKTIEALYFSLLDENGVATRCVCVTRDITERRRAEDAILASQARLSEANHILLMAEGMAHVGHWRIDVASKAIYWSDEIYRIFGMPIGTPPTLDMAISLYHPDDRDNVAEMVRQAIEDGKPFSFEMRIIRTDGAIRTVASNSIVEFTADGAAASIIGTFQDITEQKEAEQQRKAQYLELQKSHENLEMMALDLAASRDQANAANQAKSNFLATMSHEIRTPMNGIMGMNGLLLSTVLTPHQRKLAETVRNSADGLLAIIDDVLDVSKLEAGKIELETVEFDLLAVVEKTIELFTPRADEKGLKIAYYIAPEARRAFYGDPTRLRQIILNFVSNALKFTEQGFVNVEVQAIPRGEKAMELRIQVIDTGPGITTSAKQRLFQPFEQADSSISRQFGGTGLGLSICKKLTELMGGTIGMDDRLGGGGSVFWVNVTLRPGNVILGRSFTSSDEQMDPQPGELMSGRILLAEDNAVNRDVAIMILESFGYTVDIAVDGIQAVAAVNAGGYDLVLMDVQMPNLDGLAATRQIRAAEGRTKRIPIVAMTANAMQGDRRLCLEAGMDDYVSKPFEPNAFLGTIARWIGTESRPQARPVTEAAMLASSEFPVLDEQCLCSLRQMISEERLVPLLVAYIESAELQVVRLKERFAAGDLARLAREAHNIIGASGNFGARRLQALAGRLEDAAKSGKMDEVTGLVYEIEDVSNSSTTALSRWVETETSPRSAIG